jgi:ribonuclease D
LTSPAFAYIDRDAEFAAAVVRWQRCDVVGIDTEFIRTRTFFPIAALYQVATDDELAIVDPLRISEWREFKSLLVDPTVVKVMHACSEDLEVFARHLDVAPENLFDTQVASGFLTTVFSPSYADLVKRHTGIELGKHETRSDWLARPLRDEQLRYAVEDVQYLLTIHRAQVGELQRLGRGAWFDEETSDRVRFSLIDPQLSYQNVRKAWRCDARQLGRLQMLCAWREGYARAKDLPRGHVIKDEQLFDLVLQKSVDRDVIQRVMEPAAVRRHGREILALIERADALPDSALPALLPAPLDATESRLLKNLKAVGAECARSLDMAEELLSRRRDLETCVRILRTEGRLPANFQGWRRQLVGDTFAAMLGGAAAP